MFCVEGNRSKEMTVDLLQFSERATFEMQSYKIQRFSSNVFMVIMPIFDRLALCTDDGYVHVFDLRQNSLLVSIHAGGEQCKVSSVKFVERNTILIVLEDSIIICVKLDEVTKRCTWPFVFPSTKQLLRDAVHFIVERNLLVFANQSLCFECYIVFRDPPTFTQLVSSQLSSWFPNERSYLLESCGRLLGLSLIHI
eukprot:TRINITY_DN10563_c0_g2_i1.p1 TRINITY_DN10563_c0_g2~~TRINITY_DN10563_c0_g2_i1.p1  ORF type:complete len:196 (-),score=12.88 TRINITY_DN10563_c0_g2_i1:33-620(-)